MEIIARVSDQCLNAARKDARLRICFASSIDKLE